MIALPVAQLPNAALFPASLTVSPYVVVTSPLKVTATEVALEHDVVMETAVFIVEVGFAVVDAAFVEVELLDPDLISLNSTTTQVF